MVTKLKQGLGSVNIPVFLYSWDEWKNTELWLNEEGATGTYNVNARAIVVLRDYSNVKRDEEYGIWFLEYPDDYHKVIIQHEYVHVLQHLIAYSKGLSNEEFLTINVGAPPSPWVRNYYPKDKWLLEDEAIYLQSDLPLLMAVDKEVCSREEVQRVLSDYMKGYWSK